MGGIIRCCCTSAFPLRMGGLHWPASGSQSSFHVDVEPVCVSQRGRKRGKAETLEVTGWLLKEGSVTSLEIVRGSCVVGVHQLLQP